VLTNAWILAGTLVWILPAVGGAEGTAHNKGRHHGPEELRWAIQGSSVDDHPRRDNDHPLDCSWRSQVNPCVPSGPKCVDPWRRSWIPPCNDDRARGSDELAQLDEDVNVGIYTQGMERISGGCSSQRDNSLGPMREIRQRSVGEDEVPAWPVGPPSLLGKTKFLLSTASTCTRFPVPFHAGSLSRVLCPCCSTLLETRARRVDHLARQKPRQATPSFAPRWDTRSHARFTPIMLCRRQIQLRRSSAHPAEVSSARAVTGRIARSGAPVSVPDVPLTLLKLVQALACLKPPLLGCDSSPKLPRPARSLSSTVLPSLTLVSWSKPHQWVHRVFLFVSAQPRWPQNCSSPHPSQLRWPHRREQEWRHPQPSALPVLISTVRLGSHGPDHGIPLRARVPCVRTHLSAACAPDTGPDPLVRVPASVADRPGPLVSARTRPRPRALPLICSQSSISDLMAEKARYPFAR
jgi:hypothetical protein